MGVTPISGGVIPRYILASFISLDAHTTSRQTTYDDTGGDAKSASSITHPLIPSCAIVFLTTSRAPL
jgi:hypothetical protein